MEKAFSGQYKVFHKPKNDFPWGINKCGKGVVSSQHGGTNVLTLSPEDALLMLSIQITKDSRVELSKIFDVAELLGHQGLNLTKAVKNAAKLGGRRMLLYTLCLTKDVLGSRLPDFEHSEPFNSPFTALVADRRRQLFLYDEDGVHDEYGVWGAQAAACLRWILIAVTAPKIALNVGKHAEHNASCGAEQWFHPLASVTDPTIGMANENSFSGSELGSKWSDPDKVSAFFGKFSY